MNSIWRYLLICASMALSLLFATDRVAAALANPHLVYSFCPDHRSCPGGKEPLSLVRGADGAFYGVTLAGGIGDSGVVFQADPVTHVYSVVHQFDPKSEGSGPAWLKVGSDGNFYGGLSPRFDGVNSIYRLTPAGEFKELHRLDLYQFLEGAMVEDGEGNWYGLIYDANEANHFVYKITPDGTFSVIHVFEQTISQMSPGIVLASDGNLYGTTFDGSGSHDNGMAYRLTRDGEFTELYEFALVSETEPGVPCVGPDGALYGLVRDGTVGLSMYRIDLDGQVTVQNIVNDGYYPYPQEQLTLMPDGYLYGLHFGPPFIVLFRISTTGEYQKLYDIPETASSLFPSILIPGFREDALYGVADVGGKYGSGMIFRFLAPPVQ